MSRDCDVERGIRGMLRTEAERGSECGNDAWWTEVEIGVRHQQVSKDGPALGPTAAECAHGVWRVNGGIGGSGTAAISKSESGINRRAGPATDATLYSPYLNLNPETLLLRSYSPLLNIFLLLVRTLLLSLPSRWLLHVPELSKLSML